MLPNELIGSSFAPRLFAHYERAARATKDENGV